MEELDAAEQARVQRTFEALEARGVHALFASDRRQALETVLGLIPRGAAIAHGASLTLQQIGLVAALKQPEWGYRYMNAEWLAEPDSTLRARLRARLSVESDYYLGSVAALCETGEAVAADKTGSRQASYVYGPPHVIWVVGINKLVPTLEDGLRRLREVALPLEDKRMKDAGADGSNIGKLVIYEHERPGRITLVLVGESLGF